MYRDLKIRDRVLYNQQIKNLENYVNLKKNWNSVEPPNQLSINNTKAFLKNICEAAILPEIRPTPMAGICLSFRNGTRHVFIQFYNKGNIHCLFADRYTDKVNVEEYISTYPITDNTFEDYWVNINLFIKGILKGAGFAG